MPAEVVQPQWDTPPTGEGAVVIIADDGRTPRVLVVPEPPAQVVGCRFRHCDRTWLVTGRRPRTQVFFAEPVGGQPRGG